MKRLLSTHYSAGAFNVAMLFIRIVSGAIMMSHGYNKLVNFASKKATFMNFLGIGRATSLSLTIFAEFFCALFIIIGLLTRLASIPLIVVMCVAIFKAHNADFFGEAELASLYLAAFVVLLLVGPGRISVDGMVGK